MRRSMFVACVSALVLVGCSDPRKECEGGGGTFHREFRYMLPVVMSNGKQTWTMLVPQYKEWCDA